MARTGQPGDWGIHGALHKSEWAAQSQPGTTIAVRIVNVDLADDRLSLMLT